MLLYGLQNRNWHRGQSLKFLARQLKNPSARVTNLFVVQVSVISESQIIMEK